MEQWDKDTVIEETATSVHSSETVIAEVAEKHETELHSDASTKLSSKEDGELSSSSDADSKEQPTTATDLQKITDTDRTETKCNDIAVTEIKMDDFVENAYIEKPFESYRQECDDAVADVSDSDDTDTDSDSTFSSSSSSSDTTSSERDCGAKVNGQDRRASSGRAQTQKVQKQPTRTRGELSLQDLPPIEDLHITVDESVHFKEIGKVSSIVEVLVVVQSNANIPPLDEETILFLEDRVVLGKIFETFGPVSCPLYSVRFNSKDHIAQHGIEIGAKVYCVPDVSEWTHYVFLEHVKAMLGSDASWENDNEPPQWCLDYSDDEVERKARAKLRMQVATKDEDSGNIEDDDSSPDEDGNNFPQKTAKFRRRKQHPAEGSRAKPIINTWPPPDRPYRGGCRGFQPRGRSANSSSRGSEFRSPARPPRFPQRHQFNPTRTFPSCFVPPNSPVPPPVPYMVPSQQHPSFPPPPPSLTPPRFIAPPFSSQDVFSGPPLSPRCVRLPPAGGMPQLNLNTAMPPPAVSPYPSASHPSSSVPPQPWTFGMLPPFPSPFPPPTVSGAPSNCWNRPPPPPFTPPTN